MRMTRTEAIKFLLKIVTLHSCEERMGDQRGTKIDHNASTVAAAVGENSHLRMERC